MAKTTDFQDPLDGIDPIIQSAFTLPEEQPAPEELVGGTPEEAIENNEDLSAISLLCTAEN